jgi:steroid 5-alpha reductase family enzyme
VIPALAAAALLLVLALAGAWAVQRVTRNSGWIDLIWTISVGIAAALSLAILPGEPSRRILLGMLVLIWSARLGLHILGRTLRTKDDPRYARLMEDWGAAAPLRLFLFLQVQAFAGMVLVLAVMLAAASASPVTAPGSLAFAALALVSIIGEGVADAQLAACKRQRPANGICERGLWSVSRHPNYFFEWLFWVGIAGIAVSPPTSAVAWLALAAPLMMYGLLRYASGVPHLEAHMRRTRGEAFAEYARRVPEFFPRLPR